MLVYLGEDLRNCHNRWLVRDVISLIATFKYFRAPHATAIMQSENLHPDTCYNFGKATQCPRILPPLQKKYASCVSPIGF